MGSKTPARGLSVGHETHWFNFFLIRITGSDPVTPAPTGSQDPILPPRPPPDHRITGSDPVTPVPTGSQDPILSPLPPQDHRIRGSRSCHPHPHKITGSDLPDFKRYVCLRFRRDTGYVCLRFSQSHRIRGSEDQRIRGSPILPHPPTQDQRIRGSRSCPARSWGTFACVFGP